ncbi:MAG: Chromate transport protein ChrA [uncultured Thermomicrobiales bacterium]|uniref:Chromate transport protein ChrA n=1 Tax=uncultured Thermomicrobiales bacterium TaxID=1645740 RepID=A0A6J4VUK2_9BACT|nr:MAG: Chromate transport protein ChrA [uncultured Thermomicrobiales bacterium]
MTSDRVAEVRGDLEAAVGPRAGLRDVALVSLKLGCTAFGGPAAHIAMLRDETVVSRRWTTDQHFLDLLGATNLIPGPNSTEMVIHTGYEQAGWRGLVVGGSLFILPAAAITLGFAWLYVRYGTTPAGEWLLYGVKPVVIAVVAQAIWGVGRTAATGPLPIAVGLVTLALALLGASELALLLGAGALVAVARNVGRLRGYPWGMSGLLPLGWSVPIGESTLFALAAGAAEPYGAARLFLLFLRVGATLYGSGYVLVAFLQGDLVERLGWLTERQLLDAVAVGQFTPGPVFTTATFVGYLVGGWSGAALATLGIFLPAFVLVAAINPFVPRLRRSPWTAGFLDGVNAAAVGLMAAVAWLLGREAVVDVPTALLAVAAAALLIRFKVNSVWLIVGGAAAGLLTRGAG